MSKQNSNSSSTEQILSQEELLVSYHRFLKNVTCLLEDLKTNVAVAEIMSFVNLLKRVEEIPVDIWEGFLKVLAPFAPHLAEELWYDLHGFDKNDPQKSIHLTSWPTFREDLCVSKQVRMAVQVNGKVRGEILVAQQATEEEIVKEAKQVVQKYLQGKSVKFCKVIPQRLVTLVVE